MRGGVDAAVAEDVCEAHNVLETLIVRPGEKVPQIVGKDLLFEHPCRFCQPFQHLPDVGAVKRPTLHTDIFEPPVRADQIMLERLSCSNCGWIMLL